MPRLHFDPLDYAIGQIDVEKARDELYFAPVEIDGLTFESTVEYVVLLRGFFEHYPSGGGKITVIDYDGGVHDLKKNEVSKLADDIERVRALRSIAINMELGAVAKNPNRKAKDLEKVKNKYLPKKR